MTLKIEAWMIGVAAALAALANILVNPKPDRLCLWAMACVASFVLAITACVSQHVRHRREDIQRRERVQRLLREWRELEEQVLAEIRKHRELRNGGGS